MIYMTTDEWREISKIIEEKDWKELAEEIAVRTYDLEISKQELDSLIKDYTTKRSHDENTANLRGFRRINN